MFGNDIINNVLRQSRKTTRVSTIGQAGENLIPMVPIKKGPKN
jgi:aldehyde:ferredoxin oxidoreductase